MNISDDVWAGSIYRALIATVPRISPAPCFVYLRPSVEVLFTGWHHAHSQSRFCLRRLRRRVWKPLHAPFHSLWYFFFAFFFYDFFQPFYQVMSCVPAAAQPSLKRRPLVSPPSAPSAASHSRPTRSASFAWTLLPAGGALPVATPLSRAQATLPESSLPKELNSFFAPTTVQSRKPAVSKTRSPE